MQIDLKTMLTILMLAAAVPTTVLAQDATEDIFPRQETAEADDEPEAADLTSASDLVRDKKYPEALSLLEEMKGGYPEDPSLLLMLGELYLATGHPAEAVEPLRKAAALAPERERINFQLGSALVQTGEPDRALEAFGRELQVTLDPQITIMSRLNRSLLLQNIRKWKEAALEMEEVLELEPDREEVYGELAGVYLRAGDLDNARKTLVAGEEHGFRSAAHYYGLGARFYRQARYAEAVAALTSALEIEPAKAEAERSLAASLEKLGKNEEAAIHLKKYLELKPDAPDREKILNRIEAAGSGS